LQALRELDGDFDGRATGSSSSGFVKQGSAKRGSVDEKTVAETGQSKEAEDPIAQGQQALRECLRVEQERISDCGVARGAPGDGAEQAETRLELDWNAKARPKRSDEASRDKSSHGDPSSSSSQVPSPLPALKAQSRKLDKSHLDAELRKADLAWEKQREPGPPPEDTLQSMMAEVWKRMV